MREFNIGLKFDRTRLFEFSGHSVTKSFIDEAFSEFPDARFIPVFLKDEGKRVSITRSGLYYSSILVIPQDVPLFEAFPLTAKAGLKEIPFWVSERRGGDVVGVSCVEYLEQLAGQYKEYLKLQEELLINSSPLTRMPGVLSLKAKINELYGTPFGILFGDLNYFKQFNDRYGQAKGDEAILAAGKIFKSFEDGNNFPFHAGGDEFFMVTCLKPLEVSEIGSVLADAVGHEIRELLPEKDKNGFLARGREGVMKNIIPGIGIAGIYSREGKLTYEDFTYLITGKLRLKEKVKKMCEKTEGSASILRILGEIEEEKNKKGIYPYTPFRRKGFSLMDYIIFMLNREKVVKVGEDIIYTIRGRLYVNNVETSPAFLRKRYAGLSINEYEIEARD